MLRRAFITILLLSSIAALAQLPPGAAYQQQPNALIVTPPPSAGLLNTPTATFSQQQSSAGISLADRAGATPGANPYPYPQETPYAYYQSRPNYNLHLPPGVTLEAEWASQVTQPTEGNTFLDFGDSYFTGNGPIMMRQTGPTLADVARAYRQLGRGRYKNLSDW